MAYKASVDATLEHEVSLQIVHMPSLGRTQRVLVMPELRVWSMGRSPQVSGDQPVPM